MLARCDFMLSSSTSKRSLSGLSSSGKSSAALPFVILPCDLKYIGEHPFQALGKKYADAVRIGAHCLPLPIPVGVGLYDDPNAQDAYLSLASGILFTGSRANVHPRHFGQTVHNPELPLDEDRDATTLPMLLKAIALGIPVLCICRGFQELNVALGGSLHQAVQEVPGRMDHREPAGDMATQFALAHEVNLAAGGVLAGLLNTNSIAVNSLHGQGIDRLADGLVVEATAPDGQIECVRVKDALGFTLAVQWHPEWDIENNPTGQLIFKAFGEACYAYAEQQNALRKTVPTG